MIIMARVFEDVEQKDGARVQSLPLNPNR
jgi:hypothetical protein